MINFIQTAAQTPKTANVQKYKTANINILEAGKKVEYLSF